MPRVNASTLDRSYRLARLLTQCTLQAREAGKVSRSPAGRINAEAMKNVFLKWSQTMLGSLNMHVNISGVPVSTDPVLITSNHMGYLDIPVLMQYICQNRRNFGVFVSKKEVESWPIFGFAATAGGTIYVDRKNPMARRKLSESIGRVINEDRQCVAIFPEGTSSVELLPFKQGPFVTAKEHNLTIQPVCIYYEPLRDCAYVDDDTMLPHLWNLTKFRRLEAYVEGLEPRRVHDLEQDAEQIRQEILAAQARIRSRIAASKSS